MKKQNTGITLIALVITIIVLLILAGVTIATLTGENGILTQATNAKKESSIAQAREEVELAIANLKIEESQRDMTYDEKVKFLEDELKGMYSSQEIQTMLKLSENGGTINHRGFVFEVDENFNVSFKDEVNLGEWDSTATPEDCFIWLSDDRNSDDYGTIIGYKTKVSGYTKLKFPTRCKRVELTYYEDRYRDAGTTYEGSRSFVYNTKEIELPGTVTSIGAYAFSTYSSVTSITIPDSVTSIEAYAFSNCSRLNSITIPQSVTSIGEYAFAWCSNLNNITIENDNVNIDASAIEGTAFYNNHSNGLIYLGTTAVKYKGQLPANSNIVIEEGTKTLADDLFLSQANLISVEIPSSVTNINENAFAGCGNLQSINVSPENPNYSSVNGILYNKNQTTILMLPASFNMSMLPSNVEILECAHPHDNNMSTYYTTTISGASELNVLFTTGCYLEDACDYVEVYNEDDTLIYSSRYNGQTALAGKRITVDGDTVKIKLITDGSVTYWGFMCIVQGN